MTLSREAQALLDVIASSESPGYDVMYGGGRFDPALGHPHRAIPIRSGPNAGKTSSAAGRYQFLGSTWDDVAQRYGLRDFSPASQDAGAWALASETYRGKTGRDLQADLAAGSLGQVANALRGQWTSLPGGIEQGQNSNQFLQRYTKALTGNPQALVAAFSPTPIAPKAPTATGTLAAPPSGVPGVPALAGDPGGVFGTLASLFLQNGGGAEASANDAAADDQRRQLLTTAFL